MREKMWLSEYCRWVNVHWVRCSTRWRCARQLGQWNWSRTVQWNNPGVRDATVLYMGDARKRVALWAIWSLYLQSQRHKPRTASIFSTLDKHSQLWWRRFLKRYFVSYRFGVGSAEKASLFLLESVGFIMPQTSETENVTSVSPKGKETSWIWD